MKAKAHKPELGSGVACSTADYVSFEAALRMSADRLRALEEEVNNFVPRTRSEIQEETKTNSNVMFVGCMPLSYEDKKKFFARKMDSHAEAHQQIDGLVGDRLIAEYSVIVVMSAALIEAMINSILQYQLVKADRTGLFEAIDKWTLLQKWEYGPAVTSPTYSFRKAGILGETLRELVEARNAAMHCKGMLRIGAIRHFKGRSIFGPETRDVRPWLKQVANLPFDLHAFIADQLMPSEHMPYLMTGFDAPFPECRRVRVI